MNILESEIVYNFLKQIIPMVYKNQNPDLRQMSQCHFFKNNMMEQVIFSLFQVISSSGKEKIICNCTRVVCGLIFSCSVKARTLFFVIKFIQHLGEEHHQNQSIKESCSYI